MANFKKFTAVDGRPVWLNVHDISLAEPFNEDKQDGYVRVTFNNGNHISLREAVRFIVESP